MDKLLDWWQRGLIAALVLSIALLGVGRVEFFDGHGSISAWSVSRTTFFFWLIWKMLLIAHQGLSQLEWERLKPLTSLYAFLFVVTLSLLPDFHQAGDYRYFFFGCAHTVMIVDVFSAAWQKRWLPIMLGLFPLVLVLRGILYDPAILHFSLAHRFAKPLDHANTAGYLLAMSLPLAAIIAAVTSGWLRGLALLSCASQTLALVLTFSRGAWLGWIVSMIYLAATLKKLKVLAAFVLVCAACALVFPALGNRLASVTRPGEDPAMQERFQRLKSSLQLGMEHPLLGVGYGRGRLKETLPAYLKGTMLESAPVLHTHNVYVELFAETGAVGLAIFLWLTSLTLWRLWRTASTRAGRERHLGFGLAASWVAAIVAGLGDVPFYHHETRIYLFTLLAVAHIYCGDRTEQSAT